MDDDLEDLDYDPEPDEDHLLDDMDSDEAREYWEQDQQERDIERSWR